MQRNCIYLYVHLFIFGYSPCCNFPGNLYREKSGEEFPNNMLFCVLEIAAKQIALSFNKIAVWLFCLIVNWLRTISHWNADSRNITKVKQHRAVSVPKWMTAWGYQVQQAWCTLAVMENGSEFEILEPISNSSRVLYNHYAQITLGKVWITIFSPRLWVNHRTCVSK